MRESRARQTNGSYSVPTYTARVRRSSRARELREGQRRWAGLCGGERRYGAVCGAREAQHDAGQDGSAERGSGRGEALPECRHP
eukprot:471648-Prymnesium_polylepis.2